MRAIIDCKTCKVCGQNKPLEDFVKAPQCKNGRANQCKKCAIARSKRWDEENRGRKTKLAAELARKRKLQAVEYMGSCCKDCGKVYPPYIYQFHHLDGSTKSDNPSHVLRCGWEKAKEELDKCVMLCANCHMERHYGGSDESAD